MATHFSILAWRIPWTEEPGELQSIGSQRVGHDWSDLACSHETQGLRAWLERCQLRGLRKGMVSWEDKGWILGRRNNWSESNVLVGVNQVKKEVLVSQLCPILCDPMDYSLPGSSVHGILQARLLEWVAISFSRRSSWPRNRTWIVRIAGRFLTV